MRNTLSFVDYINDSVRLLIILETANRLKPTHRVTENRIKLYDYYLKFPRTMFDDDLVRDETKANFDEYYAFFHWKPDIVRYRSNLNYLIAKGLIEKKLEGSDLFYVVCSQGVESLSKMKSGYRQRLAALAEKSFPVVSKLSDKKIEEDIARKTDILLRRTGGEIDEN